MRRFMNTVRMCGGELSDELVDHPEGDWITFEDHEAEVTRLTADYEEVLADHRRLVRQLDVLLNGEAGAAKQASLCDIVSQVWREGIRAPVIRVTFPPDMSMAESHGDPRIGDTDSDGGSRDA